MSNSDPNFTHTICWTRMQAEAGEPIERIIVRKELERRAGDNLFYWGVGNAPCRSIPVRATKCEDIDVVFSLMKSRPKSHDVSPADVVVWNSYYDQQQVEQPLPPNVLVTSRMKIGKSSSRPHYALVCWSDKELRREHGVEFEKAAYQNADSGRPIGNSQVTALVTPSATKVAGSAYSIDFRAKLVGRYWVKLGQPSLVLESARAALQSVTEHAKECCREDWLEIVSKIRANALSDKGV